MVVRPRTFDASGSLSFSLLFLTVYRYRSRRFANDTVKPRISILVNLAGPFFGTQLITFYGQALLQGVGIQGEEITLALAAINTGIPIGMAISFVILPRVGRRPMLCWGATVCRISNQPTGEYQVLTKLPFSSLLLSCASLRVSQTSKIPQRVFNGVLSLLPFFSTLSMVPAGFG